MSRAWGWLTSCHLPVWARQPVLGLYARTFQCNLDEALDANLEHYASLSEFFRRKLRHGVRPIDDRCLVVSPADGTVLHFGRVTAGTKHTRPPRFPHLGVATPSSAVSAPDPSSVAIAFPKRGL